MKSATEAVSSPMPDLRDEFEALMPEPDVRCGEYAGPPSEGASENYYTADQLRAAMQAVAERAAKKEREAALDDAYNAMFHIKGCKVTRFDAQTAIRKLKDAAAIRAREGKGGAG